MPSPELMPLHLAMTGPALCQMAAQAPAGDTCHHLQMLSVAAPYPARAREALAPLSGCPGEGSCGCGSGSREGLGDAFLWLFCPILTGALWQWWLHTFGLTPWNRLS